MGRWTKGGVALLASFLGIGVPAAAPAGAPVFHQVGGPGSVSVGAHFACALTQAATVKCWGFNQSGELGNGSFVNQVIKKPVSVVGLTGVTALASGDDHTCALLQSGTVKCWGQNPAGQLGNGTLTDSDKPVGVKGIGGKGTLSGVIAIAAGQWHTCALLKAGAGTMACWGQNNDGVLGNGVSTQQDSTTPQSVKGIGGKGVLSGVVAISTIVTNTCALVKGQKVDCWGFNQYDELGPGDGQGPNGAGCEFGDFTQSCSPTPVLVKGISGATAVSAGACAVVKAGKITCWGTNGYKTVPGISGAASVTFGGHDVDLPNDGNFWCALLTGGTVKCWGQNPDGELGNGTTKTTNAGVSVFGLKGVTFVSAGADSACARLTSGAVDCWGANSYAQLGNGGGPNRTKPVAVVGL